MVAGRLGFYSQSGHTKDFKNSIRSFRARRSAQAEVRRVLCMCCSSCMSLNSVQSFVIENCNMPTIENGLNNVCLHPLSRTFTFCQLMTANNTAQREQPQSHSCKTLDLMQSRRQSSRLRRAKRLSGGGQSLKLSTKTAVFKRARLLIGEAKHVDWGPPFGVGPDPMLIEPVHQPIFVGNRPAVFGSSFCIIVSFLMS